MTPTKTTTIPEVRILPSTYHRHASIVTSSEILCHALALIEEYHRPFTFPIKTATPHDSSTAIKSYLVTSQANHGRTDGIHSEESTKIAVIDIEVLEEVDQSLYVHLEAFVSQHGKRVVIFSADITGDDYLGGNIQSAFMYVIIPILRSLSVSLVVGITTLANENLTPLMTHTLQWIDAQLNAIAYTFVANKFLSVVLFKRTYPTYLKLDSAAIYLPSAGGGFVVAFPECEEWAKDGKDGWCRRPICSEKIGRMIRFWRTKMAEIRRLPDEESVCPNIGEAPSMTDLFRALNQTSPALVKSAVNYVPDAAQQRASWELSGGFSPLGGHLMSWVYSPKVPGTSLIVKKTSRTEGAFYNFISQQLSGLDFGLSDKLQELDEATWVELADDNNNKNILQEQLKILEHYLPVVSDVHMEESSCYVEMENLLHTDIQKYSRRPAYCAMDLKIGTRLWGLDADERKRQRMEHKAKTTTAGSTGLCIIAYRTVDSETGRLVASIPRELTKSIVTEDGLQAHLRAFFAHATLQTLRTIYDQVCRLRDWFRYQTLVHFNSSSLFIIYDARGEAPSVVKLIDFAHASFFHSRIDESSLFGLNTLVMYLEELMIREST